MQMHRLPSNIMMRVEKLLPIQIGNNRRLSIVDMLLGFVRIAKRNELDTKTAKK